MFKRYNRLKKLLLLGILMISTLYIASCTKSNEESSTIVFKNVNVIPMNTETVLEGFNVIIEDGKIVELGKSKEIKIPKDSRIINAKGKYLTPGLADMHVHLWYEDELMLYLANGVTTIKDMFGRPETLEIKKKIKEEELLGPNLYVASTIMNGSPPIYPGSVVPETPEEARGFVTEFKKMGYDFIKVYERLTPDVYDSIIKTAKEQNIPVVGHVPELVGIEKVLESGQKSIEHLDDYIDSGKLYDMTVENEVWNSPTIVVYDRRVYPKDTLDGLEYMSPSAIQSYERSMAAYSTEISTLKRMTKKLHEKGAKLLLGTDANNPFVFPGFSIHDELYNLVDSGLTPYEAIRTGTYNAAEFLDKLDESGSVEIGKNADLVLLSANPLEDITNMKKIEGVMSKGKWINKDEIDEMLNNVSDKYKKEIK